MSRVEAAAMVGAVAAGAADAGIAVRAAAADLDLDFLAVAWENYDLGRAGSVDHLGSPKWTR